MDLMKIKYPKGYVTNKTFFEALEALTGGMDRMIQEQNARIDKMFQEQNIRIDKMFAQQEKRNQQRHQEVKKELSKLSKKIDANEVRIDNLSLEMVTRTEFEALKSKVNKLALQ